VFSLLSAIFHIVTLLAWEPYIKMIMGTGQPKGDTKILPRTNPFRWVEYTMSAAIMAVNVSVMTGVSDLAVLLLIFGSTAMVMPYGLTLELLRDNKYYWLVSALAGISYTITLSAGWVIILSYEPLASIPAIAWASMVVLAVFFNSFWFWSVVSHEMNEFDIEKGYYVLSLVSKTVLLALVLWGGFEDTSWLGRTRTCYDPSTYQITNIPPLSVPPVPQTTQSATYSEMPTRTTSVSPTASPSYSVQPIAPTSTLSPYQSPTTSTTATPFSTNVTSTLSPYHSSTTSTTDSPYPLDEQSVTPSATFDAYTSTPSPSASYDNVYGGMHLNSLNAVLCTSSNQSTYYGFEYTPSECYSMCYAYAQDYGVQFHIMQIIQAQQECNCFVNCNAWNTDATGVDVYVDDSLPYINDPGAGET